MNYEEVHTLEVLYEWKDLIKKTKEAGLDHFVWRDKIVPLFVAEVIYEWSLTAAEESFSKN